MNSRRQSEVCDSNRAASRSIRRPLYPQTHLSALSPETRLRTLVCGRKYSSERSVNATESSHDEIGDPVGT